MRAHLAVLPLLVLAVLCVAAPVRADDTESSPWHLDFDGAYGRTVVQFVGTGTVLPGCDCAELPFERRVLHATAGIGYGGMTLEGSIMVPLDDMGFEFIPWSIGIRIDTSYTAPIALEIRFAYVDRWGDVPGNGGRAGVGIALRPFKWFTGYAAASIDVTSVPEDMRNRGTLVSYATLLEAGARISFFAP